MPLNIAFLRPKTGPDENPITKALFRNTLVTPAPHIQGKNMNKHLDKI